MMLAFQDNGFHPGISEIFRNRGGVERERIRSARILIAVAPLPVR
jgi:hypothetical protein